MIFLPPLPAPKRHMITHHCIEITNNKRRTACSRCHRRRRSRCRRRNVAVNERGALVYPGDSGAEGTLNIVSPIEGYERGVCAQSALLTRNENVATQPCEVAQRILVDGLGHLLFRLEEGAARAEGARRRRDNEDAFRGNVREDI